MKDYIPCVVCGKKADWAYMPGNENYCENHVPRGCSCNEEADGTQPTDEHGRLYPCCEYMKIEEEFQTEPNHVNGGWEAYYEMHPEQRRESDEVEHWEHKLGLDKE